MKIIIITIILTMLASLEAKPNQCCADNKPITVHRRCMNNVSTWATRNCKNAYSIDPNNYENYEIFEDDDMLILPDVAFIVRDKYCVGSLETENNTVILICFPEMASVPASKIVVVICMILSILCLLLTLIVYLILPRLRDLQGKCIMATVFSLLISFIILALVQQGTTVTFTTCYLIATSIYFWFLCAFFWMNIVAFHIWRSIINPSYPANKTKIFRIYNAYGWGGPIIILIIAKICYHIPGDHLKPTWALHTCWFSDFHSTLVFFHAPMIILLTCNVIMFISSAWELRKHTDVSSDIKLRSRKYKFLLCLKLFLTTGICWIFEPISLMLQYEYLSNIWLITDIINVLQGVVIFLLLVVFRKRVRRDLARHKGICCRKLPGDWATIADCDELSEEAEKLTAGNDNNEI